MSKIYIADREAGNFITEVETIEEGLKTIAEFEAEDKQDGYFIEDFYELEDELHCRLEY